MKVLWCLLFCSLLFSTTSFANTCKTHNSVIQEDSSSIFIIICGSNIESVDDIHHIFIKALQLPDYYGRNLDALYDVLTDTLLVPKTIKIQISDAHELSQQIGADVYSALLSVFNEAQAVNPSHINFSTNH